MAREAKRIGKAFDETKTALIARLRERYKDALDSSNIEPILAPLADELLNEDAISDAAQSGSDAVPDLEDVRKPSSDNVVQIWVGKVRKYAKQFPERMADEISDAACAAEQEASAAEMDDADRVAHVLGAVESKAESFRSEALLYSEPPWGAGNHAYGEALDASGVLMDWVTVDDPCDICADLADGNPYTMAALPMWPGDTHPNCRCYVTPDDESWQNIFGDAAA